jgi:hypothetical protein
MEGDDVGVGESLHHLDLRALLPYFVHGLLVIDGHLLGDEVVIGLVLDDGGHLCVGEAVLWLLRPIVYMIRYFFSNIPLVSSLDYI